MMFRDVVTLVGIVEQKDPDGFIEKTEVKEDVFAHEKSVKRLEFYESMKAGESLAKTFIVSAFDFHKQKFVDHDGTRYRIVRTYTKDGELMELNCAEVKL